MKNLLFGLMLLVGVVASSPAKAQYVLVPVVPVVPSFTGVVAGAAPDALRVGGAAARPRWGQGPLPAVGAWG